MNKKYDTVSDWYQDQDRDTRDLFDWLMELANDPKYDTSSAIALIVDLHMKLRHKLEKADSVENMLDQLSRIETDFTQMGLLTVPNIRIRS